VGFRGENQKEILGGASGAELDGTRMEISPRNKTDVEEWGQGIVKRGGGKFREGEK